jgi:N-acetylneuraminate synthase
MPYIVAEIGSVHDGSVGNALKLVDLAKDSGASCVKFQMHLAEFETLEEAPSPGFFQSESRSSYFRRTSFSFESWKKISLHALDIGIDFLISPFSVEAVRIIRDLGIRNFKIPSGELTNFALLEEVAQDYNKVFLSTGMANYSEIEDGLKFFANRKSDIIIFQCTSIYPCPPNRVGINVISELLELFDCKVGFSDHTRNLSAALLCLGAGATYFEKHLTFSRRMYGSDAWNALEPAEFFQYSSELRLGYEALVNKVDKNCLDEVRDVKKIFEKGIYASRHLPIGTIIAREHLRMLKPVGEIPANMLYEVIGRETIQNIDENARLTWKDLK